MVPLVWSMQLNALDEIREVRPLLQEHNANEAIVVTPMNGDREPVPFEYPFDGMFSH